MITLIRYILEKQNSSIGMSDSVKLTTAETVPEVNNKKNHRKLRYNFEEKDF